MSSTATTASPSGRSWMSRHAIWIGPALVLVGEDDEPYQRAAEMMAARLPRARHAVLPGAGHIANLEAEEAFNRVVCEFLGELGAGR